MYEQVIECCNGSSVSAVGVAQENEEVTKVIIIGIAVKVGGDQEFSSKEGALLFGSEVGD